jgi:hypothetical protein
MYTENILNGTMLLEEYRDDAEELDERVDVLMPIVRTIEKNLDAKYITALGLFKKNIVRTKEAVEKTLKYVTMFQGKVGGMKVFAASILGGRLVSSMQGDKAAAAN